MTVAASQIIATAALEFSIGLAFGAGLFVVFPTSWYLFLLATPVRVGFTGLLATTVAAAFVGAAIPAGRRQVAGLRHGLRSGWPVALVLSGDRRLLGF